MSGRQFYADSFGSVRLSPYRIGHSPFVGRYATDQTVFGLYCDRLYPLKVARDEDPIPKYWKLREGVLLYDVPEMPLEIVGPDAARLLERVLTCRVETLPIGRARYGLACSEDGAILMDGVLMRLSEHRLLVREGKWGVHELAQGTRHRARCAGRRSRFACVAGPRTQIPRCARCCDRRRAVGRLQILPCRVLRSLRPDAVGVPHRLDRGDRDRDLLQQRPGTHGSPLPLGRSLRLRRAHRYGVQFGVIYGNPAYRSRYPRQRYRHRAGLDPVRCRSRPVRQARQGRLHRPGRAGRMSTAANSCSACCVPRLHRRPAWMYTSTGTRSGM